MQISSSDSRSVRVFISSTFRDMVAERTMLVRKAFPALRACYRPQGVEVLDVDLRWGVSEEQSRRGETLAICLREVDRCRPYFIAMLGSRYGWVPPPELLAGDAMAAFPQVAAYAGLSATEIEIRYGVLDAAASSSEAIFFFRNAPAVQAETPPGDEADRTAALKEAILASGARVVCYDHAEELAAAVEGALRDLIDKAGLAQAAPDGSDRDRRLQRAYVRDRLGIHLGAAANIADIDSYVEGGGAPLWIRGEAGIGKGALIANWCAHHRAANPDDILIDHYLSASRDSANPASIIRRLWLALDEATEDPVPIPESDMVFAEFPTRLARAEAISGVSGRRIVIAVDGLDKLSSGVGLHWFPTRLSPDTRLIISCTDGVSAEQIEKLGFRQLTVAPLAPEWRERMITLVLERVGKLLSGAQLSLLLGDAKCGSPIFLKRLLEELRVDATFETLDDKIARCLACADTPELFELVLERAEADCGADFVRDAVSFMLASRGGLEEAALLELAGGSLLQLATLHYVLGDSLREIDGRLALGHEHLEAAAVRRYIADDAAAAAVCKRLAAHFAKSEDISRRTDETPFQLRAAGDWEGLTAFLSDLENLATLRAWGEQELLGYWLAVAHTGATPETALLERIEAVLGDASDWNEHEAGLAREVLGFLRHAGVRGASMVRLAGGIVAVCERLRGPDAIATFSARAELAIALANNGAFRAAAEIEQQLVIAETALRGAHHEETLKTKSNLAETLRELGEYRRAETLHREVSTAYEALHGPDHPATLLGKANLALALADLGDFAGALALEEEVLEKRTRLLGARHPDTLTVLNNLCLTLDALGDFRRARTMTEELVALLEDLNGPDHPHTLTTLNNLASLARSAGDLDLAEEIVRRTLATRQRTCGPDHPDTFSSLNSLALTISDRGDEAAAEAMLRDLVERATEARGAGHPDTLTHTANWAGSLFRLGRLGEAEALERNVLAARTDHLGPDHPGTLLAMANLALTLVERGNLKEAVPLLERALAWRTETFGFDHPDTLKAAANLGSVLCDVGDYERAGRLEVAVLERRRALLGDDHPDTLSSMINVASGLRGAGRAEEALQLEAKVLDVYLAAHGRDHPDTLIALNNIAQTFQALGEDEAALEFQEEVLARQLRVAGPDHPRTLASMSNLAVTLCDKGEIERAAELQRDVVARRTRLLGAHHPDTIRSRDHLRTTLGRLSKADRAPRRP